MYYLIYIRNEFLTGGREFYGFATQWQSRKIAAAREVSMQVPIQFFVAASYMPCRLA